jgi:hypothetical protein
MIVSGNVYWQGNNILGKIAVGGTFEGTGQGFITIEGAACVGIGKKVEVFKFPGGLFENCDISEFVSFSGFETIARTAQSSTNRDGTAVVVVNSGGSYANSDFDISSERGKSMVVFNTASDITITKKLKGDEPFIPILVAPFSTVTIDSASQGSYGMIVAKNLVGGSTIQAYGDSYTGSIPCPTSA